MSHISLYARAKTTQKGGDIGKHLKENIKMAKDQMKGRLVKLPKCSGSPRKLALKTKIKNISKLVSHQEAQC